MSNSNSKVTTKLSPKSKRTRVTEPLDVGSPTPTGFKHIIKHNCIFNLRKLY